MTVQSEVEVGESSTSCMKSIDLDKFNIAAVELDRWDAVDLSEVESDSHRVGRRTQQQSKCEKSKTTRLWWSSLTSRIYALVESVRCWVRSVRIQVRQIASNQLE